MEELVSFKNLKSILLDYAIAVRNKYKDNLLSSDRVATGDLIRSVEYQLDFKGSTFLVCLNLEDYWKWVEKDTKPHFPPFNAILSWVKAKPILPQPMANGKLPTPNQLAYLIQRKIGEVGTEGSHDLENTLNQMNKEYEDLIIEALDKDIGEALDKVMLFIYKP